MTDSDHVTFSMLYLQMKLAWSTLVWLVCRLVKALRLLTSAGRNAANGVVLSKDLFGCVASRKVSVISLRDTGSDTNSLL